MSRRVFAGVERNPGVLLMSVVDADLRAEFEKRCTERHIPHVSVLDPVVDLGLAFGRPREPPGGQRQLDTAYFERMAAVDFAVRHDDGLNMAELHDADILLVGVSAHRKPRHPCIWRIAVTKSPITPLFRGSLSDEFMSTG